MRPVLQAYIGSAILEMSEHEADVKDACLRQGIFPILSNISPAKSKGIIESTRELMKTASIYIAIYAYKYGEIIDRYGISLIEAEFNIAQENRLPTLVFIPDKDHPFRRSDIDTDDSRIESLKSRAKQTRTPNTFKSASDLRSKLINSLSRFRDSDVTKFHHVSDIPPLPQAYIAHPYCLLSTTDVIGRKNELNMLTECMANQNSDLYSARVLCLVAIGGMGKSAVAWKWFKEIAPLEMKEIKGRMWWSFYESDATFENFVIRALAYFKGCPKEEARRIPGPEREQELLDLLNHNPYLIVLDGLERILIAYAAMDAAKMQEDGIDQESFNLLSGVDARKHRLRKTSDPRAGAFLRRLSQIARSRILATTRLYPSDLQTPIGREIPGCKAVEISGLNDDDAVELWRKFGVTGTRRDLLPIFQCFGNFPLLICALAGEVAKYRSSPGDFEAWRLSNPDFNPFALPMSQRKSHVLEYATRGLSMSTRKGLITIAAFRMPVTYDMLASLTVGNDKTFIQEHELDQVLCELEDRGLIGWDKRANRYDMHPIVRGVMWHRLGAIGQKIIYDSIRSQMDAIAATTNRDPEKIEDLTPAIELYYILVGLQLYEEAFSIYTNYLVDPFVFKISAHQENVAMLKALSTSETTYVPRIESFSHSVFALTTLAISYDALGQYDVSQRILNDALNLSTLKEHISEYLRVILNLAMISGSRPYVQERFGRYAVKMAKRADEPSWEVAGLIALANSLYIIGRWNEARNVLNSALDTCRSIMNPKCRFWLYGAELGADTGSNEEATTSGYFISFRHQVSIYSLFSELAVAEGDFEGAVKFADRGLELSTLVKRKGLIIAPALARAHAAIGLNLLDDAHDDFSGALNEARAISSLRSELTALSGLAEVHCKMGNIDKTRSFVDEVRWLDERVLYPIPWVDGLNTLARAESLSNPGVAAELAEQAYRIAWLDGSPYCYQEGIAKSKSILESLGVKEPCGLPAFNPRLIPLNAELLDEDLE